MLDLFSTIDVLTVQETNRKEQLEAQIERGLQTFVEVGLALMEIRDERLYRAEFGTFEEYCNQRWGWERRHAYRLIDAAAVVKFVSNWTQIEAPANEAQARPLTPLPPDLQREAWREAVDTAPNGKVTAAHVQSVVDKMTQREPVRPMAHVGYNGGNNEWYTPAEYIKAAREVMGVIDLDPASTEVANTIVQAAKFYTAENNGLLYDWHGNVWMNPPYAQPAIGQFADQMAREYRAGRVKQAIVLVNNATETAWFNTLIQCAAAVCFPVGRIRFWAPGRELAQPLQGQAIMYLGNDPDLFIRQFCDFGWCAEVA